jgi:hypothetical protein
MVAALLRARAFWPTPVREVTRYVGGVLPVPGSPHVVFTPGHTLGHCALHFPDRDTVIVGDAVVMLDPYTAETGWPERPPRTRSAHSSRSTPWPTPGHPPRPGRGGSRSGCGTRARRRCEGRARRRLRKWS